MNIEADVLTPLEAAKYVRVHRETLYDLIRSGTIKASKVGGRWRIQKSSLDSYLQKDDVPAPVQQPVGYPSSPGVLLERPGGQFRREQTGTKRVLIVDDNPQICEFFEIALTRRGHYVSKTQSGREALELMKHEVYDLIFIDLIMPEMDGVETLKAIKSIDPDPTIVLITGYPDGELVTKALGLGPFVLLDKPVRVADLIKVVEG